MGKPDYHSLKKIKMWAAANNGGFLLKPKPWLTKDAKSGNLFAEI